MRLLPGDGPQGPGRWSRTVSGMKIGRKKPTPSQMISSHAQKLVQNTQMNELPEGAGDEIIVGFIYVKWNLLLFWSKAFFEIHA